MARDIAFQKTRNDKEGDSAYQNDYSISNLNLEGVDPFIGARK